MFGNSQVLALRYGALVAGWVWSVAAWLAGWVGLGFSSRRVVGRG